MRISDWSSDVCSSDLHDAVAAGEVARAPLRRYTHVLPQLAGVAQPIARGLVQIAHLGIGVGEDDPGLVRIGAALRVPCVDQPGPRNPARLGPGYHALTQYVTESCREEERAAFTV